MIKIGITAFVTKSDGGGYQYMISQIKALASLKNPEEKYIVFVNSFNNELGELGLEVRKISQPENTLLSKLRRMILLSFGLPIPLFFTKKEKELFKDIDCFISPTMLPYPHYYLNKPFIFTLHDMQDKYHPEFFTLKQKLVRLIINRALSKSAKAILCESNYVKDDIAKFLNVAKDKIYVLPAPHPWQFINLSDLLTSPERIKEKYHLPNKYIFYPAQFWYHKNHLRLLGAFNQLKTDFPDVHLVFTGAKKNNYENVMKKIQDYGLADKVHHLGYLDYNDLPLIYKNAEMLIMPSLFESVSIPIYEAFFLKVPVGASRVCAIPEQVGNAALLFNPLNVADLVNKIQQLLKNKSLAQELAERGYRRVNATLNVNRYAEKLSEIIQKIFKE